MSEANSDERTHRRDDASWTYELTKRAGISAAEDRSRVRQSSVSGRCGERGLPLREHKGAEGPTTRPTQVVAPRNVSVLLARLSVRRSPSATERRPWRLEALGEEANSD